jgi:C4-type Zn-finger protein
MKRCLDDDEIERQLKCKICDVELCILRVLRGVPYKGKIQLHDAGGRRSLCIHQANNYKKKGGGMHIEFYSI